MAAHLVRSPRYQSAVYKLVLSAGDAATFDQILGLFESRPLNEEKKSCLVGLGAAPTDALRTKALDFALSDAVKLQDYFYVALATHGFPRPRGTGRGAGVLRRTSDAGKRRDADAGSKRGRSANDHHVEVGIWCC